MLGSYSKLQRYLDTSRHPGIELIVKGGGSVRAPATYLAMSKLPVIDCPALPGKLQVNGRDLFGAMMRESNVYDSHVRRAIQRIRAAGKHKIIALTNNFSRVDVPPSELTFLGWDNGAAPAHLRELFDDFCDSSEVGLRKPDPAFYLLACSRNNVEPQEVVFLDDIGMNLRTAKELGMKTIHVSIGGTLKAVKELENLIHLDLTGEIPGDGGYSRL
ncbi:hypothetical protein AX16_003674 [Volvariella volvacea WC 439]|nr:hypothetical protein AX16_003674 [Volvariella volvacea WC 439]